MLCDFLVTLLESIEFDLIDTDQDCYVYCTEVRNCIQKVLRTYFLNKIVKKTSNNIFQTFAITLQIILMYLLLQESIQLSRLF